jgi:hypothetical protein
MWRRRPCGARRAPPCSVRRSGRKWAGHRSGGALPDERLQPSGAFGEGDEIGGIALGRPLGDENAEASQCLGLGVADRFVSPGGLGVGESVGAEGADVVFGDAVGVCEVYVAGEDLVAVAVQPHDRPPVPITVAHGAEREDRALPG